MVQAAVVYSQVGSVAAVALLPFLARALPSPKVAVGSVLPVEFWAVAHPGADAILLMVRSVIHHIAMVVALVQRFCGHVRAPMVVGLVAVPIMVAAAATNAHGAEVTTAPIVIALGVAVAAVRASRSNLQPREVVAHVAQ